MPTSFSPVDVEILSVFAVELASAARIFTTRQLARHRVLSNRKEPVKRASEMLAPCRHKFEVIPWTQGKPFLWRLSAQEKRKIGLKYRNVGASQHTAHWLTLGDVWMQLVFNGLRPEKWFTEGKEIGRFDVFTVIQRTPYLMEVQLSPLSKREWERKWYQRIEWLKQRRWKDEEWAHRFSPLPPKVLLVTTQPMSVLVPKGSLHAKSIEQLHYIMRPPQ